MKIAVAILTSAILILTYIISNLKKNSMTTQNPNTPNHPQPPIKLNFGSFIEVSRGCDASGCGHFLASRKRWVNGEYISVERAHKGFDIVKEYNESITAPFDCKIKRLGVPFTNNPHNYQLIELESIDPNYEGFVFKVMYVQPLYDKGEILTEGQLFAVSQDLSLGYGSNMTNHIHVELRIKGQLVDPEKYINL